MVIITSMLVFFTREIEVITSNLDMPSSQEYHQD